jgi:hypothetical protein
MKTIMDNEECNDFCQPRKDKLFHAGVLKLSTNLTGGVDSHTMTL